jgi:hypothetical protein
MTQRKEGVVHFEWTKEKIDLLLQRWNEGVSTRAIGAELGIKKGAVTSRAHKYGATPRPSPITVGSPTRGRGFLQSRATSGD